MCMRRRIRSKRGPTDFCSFPFSEIIREPGAPYEKEGREKSSVAPGPEVGRSRSYRQGIQA